MPTLQIEMMVDKGGKLKAFEIREWYDCGRPEMLLNVNKLLLDQKGSTMKTECTDTVIIEPVMISEGCVIERGIIGPYVSIDANTTVTDCIISNSVIGQSCELKERILKDSVIGDEVTLHGRGAKLEVGENTKMVME